MADVLTRSRSVTIQKVWGEGRCDCTSLKQGLNFASVAVHMSVTYPHIHFVATMTQTTPESSIPFSSSWLRVPVAAEERAAKRRRYTSDIVVLKVGEKKETLTIHENKLGEDSAFFPAALKESWAEGQKGAIELPDDDFDAVAYYVDWLYCKQIIGCVNDDNAADYITLAKLFVFGEKMQGEEFQSEVLRTMIKGMDQKDTVGRLWVLDHLRLTSSTMALRPDPGSLPGG
ncbi:hypothetical protein CLAFUW4_03614 [Fulvia fulva]|uniref:BTB domain-containing protein n=1 Tax=Passalora fulva TaxID=5499 RepID=A0A9Q8LBQ0_PASFU|nr:uncharacterized protein CLAFUR5_03593 [Fulvia fulva]KAK4632286.1 hypothetical protein CLAFUR4_03602 [Fulvia fulva]KAK4633330.1 hypothetical protein CLAFUR0_03605 [Fulvia fulva]UJO14449.1 hypothetical protein CLAFUR5_03593 [Fulvia fulva]WPV11000.1 hypothetical protein CLAFUW4_03614 [Fulvia fulva]WPV25802.1 hypothetical protein CLAFUW7_03606 [Fulvia fulva]